MSGYTNSYAVVSMQCNIGRQLDRCPVTRRVSTHNINLTRTSHNRDRWLIIFRLHLPQRSVISFSFIFNCRIESFGFVFSSSPAYGPQRKPRCTLARCDGEIHRQSPIIPRRLPSPTPQGANRPDNPGHGHFSLRVANGRDPRWWPPPRSAIPFESLDRSSTYDYPLRRAM